MTVTPRGYGSSMGAHSFTPEEVGLGKVRGQSVDISKKEAPQISGLRGFCVPIMHDAEGQGRTDTALPLPVHESGASYIS